MRLTLLRMTQLILSAMDSDEINSIEDTVEAQQVVDQIETVYYDILAQMDRPEWWDLFELEAIGLSTPTLMRLPDNCTKLEWVQYDFSEDGDTKRNFRHVFPMERVKFFDRMNSLDTNNSDVYQYTYQVQTGTFDVRGHNERFPVYYTTTDDKRLIFDNYRADLNQTLVGNKTQCYGMLIPVFTREDSFIPDLEPRQFTLLFNEAKAQSFSDLKQVTNGKAEQKARRGWSYAHRKDPQVPDGLIYHDFTYDFGRRKWRR